MCVYCKLRPIAETPDQRISQGSPLSAAEMLPRLKSYGARIRSQRVNVLRSFFSALRDDNGAVELYRALYQGELDQYLPMASLPSSGLFPNLRTLDWRTGIPETYAGSTIKSVSYFLTPSLKRLEVSGINGNTIAPFLRTLNSIDDLRLESLQWNIDAATEALLQADDEVRLFLRQHQEHLRHFSTLDPVFIRHFQKEICGLSRLQSIGVVAADELQAFGLVEGLVNVMPEIEDLRLGVHSSQPYSGWRELWDALKRLRKLTTLHLRLRKVGELNEEDARSMSEAWPALSRLYILQGHTSVIVFDPNFLPTPESSLSFDFFNAIAQHFSQSLTTLALCLGPNICSPLPINPVRFEKLQNLYIQSCFGPEDRETLHEYFTQVLPPSGSLICPPTSGPTLLLEALATISYFEAAMAKKNRPKYEPDYWEPEPLRETDPLRITEILIRVLELASPEGKAVAAGVCRRWSKPALEMLWQDLTDLAPFLKLLVLLKKVRNCRMSPAEKLERVKSYGVLIRTLRFDAFKSSVHESTSMTEVYRAFSAGNIDRYVPTGSLPWSRFFPNLHTLEWRANESQTLVQTTLTTVSRFLNPSLKHIYVSGISGLPLNPYNPYDWAPPVKYAPFFQALRAMETLRLESLDLQIGQEIGVVEQADEITIFLRRHLETLVHFNTWTPEFIHHLQNELLGLSRLRSLEMVADHEPQASGFIERLAKEIPEMEVLHLKIDPTTREPNQWQRLWDALKHLRKLRKLHLELSEIEELEEEDARSMREAWPDLSCFYILQNFGGWRAPYPGFSRNFLSAITHHFSPSLTTLGLCLEPNNIRSALPIGPLRFEKLQVLYIQSSVVPEDIEDVARYFAQILPPAAILKGKWHYEWDPVVDILDRERAKGMKDEMSI
ncbi:hypothetical protein FRC01_000081 [Tulasnella sp. 417]|nr:hypothetical protein FRC01_000081 [Tulasnella sp. 417]